MLSGQGTTVYHSTTNSYQNQQVDSELKNVQVVIEFTRIGEIDTMNEKYQAEVIIESKWVEKREMTTYDPDVDWNPKVSCSLRTEFNENHCVFIENFDAYKSLSLIHI